MHGEYFGRAIVQYTEIYYFGANTYDEYYNFKIYSCVLHAATLKDHNHNTLISGIVQIS